VAYRSLLALGALDAAGYSLIVPVLPEIARATGGGPALLGLLVASFPAGMIAGFWLGGRIVRRHGVGPLIPAALALIAVGALGFVLLDSLAVYFVSRVVMGLGSAGLWLGVTFDTIARWPGQEYVCMSRILAAYSIGGLAGPALGAVGGIAAPFALYLALVIAAFLLLFALRPVPGGAAFGSDPAVLRARSFRIAALAGMFTYLVLGLMEGTLPLHLAERLGQAEIGALFVGLALVVAAGSAGAGSRRPRSMVLGSVVLAAAGISLAGAVSSVPVWILALGLAALAVGIGGTGAFGLLVEAVDVDRIVTALVVFSQAGIAGYLVGPLIGGLAAEGLGYAAVGLVPAVFGAGLLAAMIAGPTPIQASTSGQVRPTRTS
jgi:MFS family permease